MRTYPMAEPKNWRYYAKEYENWLWQKMGIDTSNHTHTCTALLKLQLYKFTVQGLSWEVYNYSWSFSGSRCSLLFLNPKLNCCVENQPFDIILSQLNPAHVLTSFSKINFSIILRFIPSFFFFFRACDRHNNFFFMLLPSQFHGLSISIIT